MRTYLVTAMLLAATALVGVAAGGSNMCDNPPCTKREIQAYEQRVGRHMIRMQNARFEAKARGETKKTGRYDREFKKTQQRWMSAKRALETAND
jgi:hypothetical protein